MTARGMHYDDTCCFKGCGALGAYTMNARLWAESDLRHERPPMQLQIGLLVCQAHRDKPLQTAPQFFAGDEQRQFVRAAAEAMRVEQPDFNGAAWWFIPLNKPEHEVAH